MRCMCVCCCRGFPRNFLIICPYFHLHSSLHLTTAPTPGRGGWKWQTQVYSSCRPAFCCACSNSTNTYSRSWEMRASVCADTSECIHLHVHVHTCIHTYTYMCIYMYIRIMHVHIYIKGYVQTCLHIQVHKYKWLHYLYVYTCIYIHVYIYTWICIFVYIYIFMYTSRNLIEWFQPLVRYIMHVQLWIYHPPIQLHSSKSLSLDAF